MPSEIGRFIGVPPRSTLPLGPAAESSNSVSHSLAGSRRQRQVESAAPFGGADAGIGGGVIRLWRRTNRTIVAAANTSKPIPIRGRKAIVPPSPVPVTFRLRPGPGQGEIYRVATSAIRNAHRNCLHRTWQTVENAAEWIRQVRR
jgi:hypothetical protein